MSNLMVAIFFGVGVAAFAYSKITRRTGGLPKNDLTVAGIAGLFAFLIMLSVMAVVAGK